MPSLNFESELIRQSLEHLFRSKYCSAKNLRVTVEDGIFKVRVDSISKQDLAKLKESIKQAQELCV